MPEYEALSAAELDVHRFLDGGVDYLDSFQLLLYFTGIGLYRDQIVNVSAESG